MSLTVAQLMELPCLRRAPIGQRKTEGENIPIHGFF